MSTSLVLLSLILLVLLFTGYYVFRLVSARREFTRRQGRQLAWGANDVGASGHSPLMSARAQAATRGTAEVRVHDAPLGLRRISQEPVFVRKRKDGETTVQLEQRPAAPLRYILDPLARHVLEQVVARAESDYGNAWSVLAEEDDEGRLRLTRLD